MFEPQFLENFFTYQKFMENFSRKFFHRIETFPKYFHFYSKTANFQLKSRQEIKKIFKPLLLYHNFLIKRNFKIPN